MVETTLVAPERLSETLKEEGRQILVRLDAKNAEMTAAFWTHLEEEDTWRLYLATPLTGTKGPLFVYKMLQEILEDLSLSSDRETAIELMNIAVVNPNLMLVQDMQHRYGHIDKENDRLNRRSDSPYIYRLAIDKVNAEKRKTNGKN